MCVCVCVPLEGLIFESLEGLIFESGVFKNYGGHFPNIPLLVRLNGVGCQIAQNDRIEQGYRVCKAGRTDLSFIEPAGLAPKGRASPRIKGRASPRRPAR